MFATVNVFIGLDKDEKPEKLEETKKGGHQ